MFREVHMYIHTIVTLLTHVCQCAVLWLFWFPGTDPFTHESVKQGRTVVRMIEQGFKWTMVETQQQRENSRVEHCFCFSFLFHTSFPSSFQALELDSACSLSSSCLANSCCEMPMLSNINPTENVVCPNKRCNWNMTAMLCNVMWKHNVHVDVTQTTSLCTCLPPTIEIWQAHTLFSVWTDRLFRIKESTCRRDGQQAHKQMDWHDSSCLLVQLCVASTSSIIYRERCSRTVDTIRAAFLSPSPKEESAAFFAPSMAYRTRSASAPSSRCSNEPSIEDQLQIINETIGGGLEVCLQRHLGDHVLD